jgi:hypothetical protein
MGAAMEFRGALEMATVTGMVMDAVPGMVLVMVMATVMVMEEEMGLEEGVGAILELASG